MALGMALAGLSIALDSRSGTGPNLRLWAKRASIVLYVTKVTRKEESVTGAWG